MKIVICGSMSASAEMVDAKNILEKKGHNVVLPKHAEKFSSGELEMESQSESAQSKIKEDLIRFHYELIKNADAILVVNGDKNGVKNYIGGNVFLEMGFAHVLDKKIFVLNGVPEIGYASEIVAMQPVCLEGDLGKLRKFE